MNSSNKAGSEDSGAREAMITRVLGVLVEIGSVQKDKVKCRAWKKT